MIEMIGTMGMYNFILTYRGTLKVKVLMQDKGTNGWWVTHPNSYSASVVQIPDKFVIIQRI